MVHTLPAHRRVPLGISLVPEGRRLFPKLTVRRNLELGAYTRDDDDAVQADVERMFELFPILKERATQAAGTMSGGEQQMLAIARGLMARPRLLMLDEPSWGIAPKFVAKVLDVIQRVNETGVAILLVEQNLHKALAIAHEGYVIQTGRIVMQGPAQQLLHDEAIKKAYLGL
jgi:branched-chain amino acid transport system ATP-binding protein